MKQLLVRKKVRIVSAFGIIMILSVICVGVVRGDIMHGTSEQWITEGMLDNTPPADYEINQNTQGVAIDGGYNRYFPEDSLQEVHIEIGTNNLNYLLQHAKEEPYVMTDKVTIGDTAVRYCGLKTKGDYTLEHSYDDNPGSDRFSFTVHFGKYINKAEYGEKQTFYGCEKISFNNFFFDKSMLKEFLAYKLLDEMGLPVPQYGLAKLYINGEYYGVYFMVEAFEESILEQYYQVKDVDGYLDKPQGTTLKYEELLANPAFLCGNDKEELADIQDILPVVLEWNKKLNYLSEGKNFDGEAIDVNSDEYLDLLGQIMNVDEAVRYFAAHSWLCQTDSMFVWLKNYGLYISEAGVCTIIPWDYDLSFGCYGNNSAEATANYALDIMYNPNDGAARGASPEQVYANFPLFHVIYQNEQLMERYYQYMGECSKIAALGGMVQSTGKVYEPAYLASYIDGLEAALLEAAKEKLADHVYYMNGITQPIHLKNALPNIRKIVAMRAVGVQLQLTGSDSRVCGAGCGLQTIGNGGIGNGSSGGCLTLVDEYTGIYVTAQYEADNFSPMLTVEKQDTEDKIYQKIKQLMGCEDSQILVYQMKNTKVPLDGYDLTIPVAQDHSGQGEIVFYTYSNGTLAKMDMQRQDNLCTGHTDSIEYVVMLTAAPQTKGNNFDRYAIAILFLIFMVVLVVLAYQLISRKKKALAIMELLLALICVPMMSLVLSEADTTERQTILKADVIPIDLAVDSKAEQEFERELLCGTSWWEDYENSKDYYLTGDGYIVLEVFAGETNDLESNGFCVEIYDDGGNYFTTTSEGDAWYAGTDGTISGVTDAAPIVPGSIIEVKVTRAGNTYTFEYYDKESREQLLKFVAKENGEFSEQIKLRVMAQIGEFTVQVLEIK